MVTNFLSILVKELSLKLVEIKENKENKENKEIISAKN